MLIAWLLSAAAAHAQIGARGAAPPPAAAPAPVETSKDALGRDTPRGTLFGFMRAAREGNLEVASMYLHPSLSAEAKRDLARQLYVVLDSRLPTRLNEISDSPEGSRSNPLKPDQDVVGVISAREGPLELVVERISRGVPTPVWLFSQSTLDAIPGVYNEINLISLDRYFPNKIGMPRLLGVRAIEWLILLVMVPLTYRLMGFTRLPGVVRLTVVAIAIQWLVASVDLPLRSRQLWATVAALLTMTCAVWLVLHVNAYIARYVRERFRDNSIVEVGSLVRLGHRIADVLVVVAGGLVALEYFGLDPTAALAGLGIGGIAVALAAQKTLENLIGGLSLIFDKAVRVGDFLRLGDVFGTVDSIGLRSTRIRTLDRTMLSVPNGQIANVNVETLSVRDMCWFHHTLRLRYETTSAQIRTVIDGVRERLTAHSAVDRASARVRLIGFGPSSLDIEIFAYVMTGDWPRFLEVQEQLLVGIMEIVERAGTAIALPTQTLHVAGDRAQRSLTAIANVSLSRDAAANAAAPGARKQERPSAGR